MSEEKKAVELKDEELEKVAGGAYIISEGNIKYKPGDLVKDQEGIRYRIVHFDSYDPSSAGYDEKDGGYSYGNNWYWAEILYMPDSVKFCTYNREGDYCLVTERNVDYY